MEFYMSEAVCKRKWSYETFLVDNYKSLVLRYRNCLRGKEEVIDIKFENQIYDLENFYNVIFSNIKMKLKKKENGIEILLQEKQDKKYNKKSNVIYALIRSNLERWWNGIPDIYIPKSKCKSVEVLKKIKVIDFHERKSMFDKEVKKGEQYEAYVFFVKIKLYQHQSLQLFQTSGKTFSLCEHDVLYRDEIRLQIEKGLKTKIYLDKQNRQDYISLSELYNE